MKELGKLQNMIKICLKILSLNQCHIVQNVSIKLFIKINKILFV